MVVARVSPAREKWVIIGAAGRDFHNFHTMVRDNERRRNSIEVLAFTAAQIPGIDSRTYPASLAGPQYPNGIPILPEAKLADIIKEHGVTHAIFSYSDVTFQHIGEISATVSAAGAHFVLPSAPETMIPSEKPVIAVCAVRTGCGKSQTSRMVVQQLLADGTTTVAVRHPMPYGDLAAQAVQRFASLEDLVDHQCTIEEMEEYEPFIRAGMVVYAGVDYGAILEQAEQEADVVLWDGGNNDTSFYTPDLLIVVADPLRPGHELRYYPGRTNFITAQVVVINKANRATTEGMREVRDNVARYNPTAQVIITNSNVTLADLSQTSRIKGKRVLVIEDGPTVTHGGMPYGAGRVAAEQYGAAKLVDPTSYTVGSLTTTFETYPHLQGGTTLPAMGYGAAQVADLAATINQTPCDVVVSGTPIDLGRVVATQGITLERELVQVVYESSQVEGPNIHNIVKAAIEG